MRYRTLVCIAASLLIPRVLAGVVTPSRRGALPHVVVQTELGDIEIEVDTGAGAGHRGELPEVCRCPPLRRRHVPSHRQDGQPARQPDQDRGDSGRRQPRPGEGGFPADRARAHQQDRDPPQGRRGVDGPGAADSATSGLFICINDQPSLDFGGMRNPDGQGFAAFGRVVRGMDVVRKIQQAPNTDAQKLTPPIKILAVTRR